ncbi:SDR family NAD(P)-dependent oxidoreductase [Microbulbifer sp. SSSA002]|uniref:SDR family NAD(P)-dependent oxidoreductase n=1 Tax=Microbulbifer sp. SSSA002 TaxID=3243376 RepID=UPI004039D662
MPKTILLTGGTDGIGLETAKLLAAKGHSLLLHGRSDTKLENAREVIKKNFAEAHIEIFRADLSDLSEVIALASQISERHSNIDILINNAGVFKLQNSTTDSGYDVRFIVNVIAPYLLTKQLLPLFNSEGRIINLSSAAQAAVNLKAFKGHQSLSDSDAYAQSKLALTMWTFQLAQILGDKAPSFIAINPASFLGSKMVKDAYGTQGKDLRIGANILVRAALDDEFSNASGKYFDNDLGNWSQPHPDALDEKKRKALTVEIENILNKFSIENNA